MKRLSYADLLSEKNRLDRDNGVLSLALNLSINTKPDAVEKFSHDGGRYTIKLYGAQRCDGGIVLMTCAIKEQSPSTTARYLDNIASDYAQDYSEHTAPIRNALYKLQMIRNRLITQATQHELAQQRSAQLTAEIHNTNVALLSGHV